MYHPGGPEGLAAFGVSEVSGAFSDHAQGANVALPLAAAVGVYRVPVTVHGLFEVSAGANTFYFVGQSGPAESSALARQFTLVYIPSGFGIVDTTVRLASFGDAEGAAAGAGAARRQDPGRGEAGAEPALTDVLARLDRLEERIEGLK